MSMGVPGAMGAMGAMIYHSLPFVTVIAAEKENRQPPQTHGDFMSGYLARFADDSYPGAAFFATPFADLSSLTLMKQASHYCSMASKNGSGATEAAPFINEISGGRRGDIKTDNQLCSVGNSSCPKRSLPATGNQFFRGVR
jgi:hypothetical protein